MCTLLRRIHTYRPGHTEECDSIEALRLNAIELCPVPVVDVVEGREDAPNSIDLRVVLVDLRDDKGNQCDEQGEGEGRDDRVGGGIRALQIIDASDR